MTGLTERYKKAIKDSNGPISLKDVDYAINIPGIVKYAREKNTTLDKLTEEETSRFIVKRKM